MVVQQPVQTEQLAEERPIAAFVLSLLAGLVILAAGVAVMMNRYPASGPPYYYGGMMGGGYYGEMMGGYYGMMNGIGFGGGWFYGLGAIGLISGVIIVIAAVMLYKKPSQTCGALILSFSVFSFFGMGGFFLGGILGVVGGIIAITWKR